MSAAWQNAYAGLGSNLGDRADHLRRAADELCGLDGVAGVRRSHIYETSPVGGPVQQPDYLNAVIHLRTTLSALELLQRCLAIETGMGRLRGVRNGPRIIDLDLLLFGTETHSTEGLQVPHPRLHERRFVLVPLVELAADLPHPLRGQRMVELLAALPPGDEEIRCTALPW